MPGPEDDDWEREFLEEDASTRIDKEPTIPDEAIPTPAPTHDTTGKYKTLSGYEVSADVQSELAFGRGCAHCTKKVLMAFKLWQMDAKVHESVAQARVDKLLMWMNDPQNAELIRVALED
jgi:hypothetical protein